MPGTLRIRRVLGKIHRGIQGNLCQRDVINRCAKRGLASCKENKSKACIVKDVNAERIRCLKGFAASGEYSVQDILSMIRLDKKIWPGCLSKVLGKKGAWEKLIIPYPKICPCCKRPLLTGFLEVLDENLTAQNMAFRYLVWVRYFA